MAATPLTIWDRISDSSKLLLIAGPCVIEDEETTLEIARALKAMTRDLDFNLVFKASFDKANRTSLSAYRGPGLAKGLQILSRVAADLHVPVISDIHTPDQAPAAAEVLDIIQIPAFLCRQTDLILAAAGTGKPINLKKGQFLAPWDISPAIAKAASTGNRRILLTERGTMLGYNNLVVDFRSLAIMADFGCPIVLDVTHSVQIPGGAGDRSTGQRQFAPLLARAAVAAGVGGVFMEVHPDPDQALCDGPNSLPLDTLPALLSQLEGIRRGLASADPLAAPTHT